MARFGGSTGLARPGRMMVARSGIGAFWLLRPFPIVPAPEAAGLIVPDRSRREITQRPNLQQILWK
jgi:hypothetical protein